MEIDAGTVRRGDQLMIGGQAFVVEDMTSMAHGAKRLIFTTGETFTLRRTTVLWAARCVDPRRRGGRGPNWSRSRIS
ncbi:hypothetical protein [Streptomyces marincola]|uniref:hypothetical protein n=1 Tax=Streptomyces marincola TaxID=2878388 RepID=UPI001CF1E1ED|nr:hypothetical protein [Streptomyces marincola]UCM87476.1 hypothetical protein LC193_05680 [Streptomyces marincola]